ncbi:MAG TPA: helix-turn-helix domain-containing protein [Dongiaceae bacterium]|nr:helix-turn-helix domain-containing protein [Dongiaceae bacterium]
MGDFGDKFRKAREKKQLSFDDVSNVTKISSRMLQAIEEEHFDRLPGGVFNRGFIRAYAKHLGLDAEAAVNDYLACLRQEQIDSHAGWDSEKHPDSRSSVGMKPAPAAAPKPAAKPQPQVATEELPELQLPRIQDVRPPKKEYLGGRPSAGAPRLLIAIAALIVIAAALWWIRHSRTPKTVAANSALSPAVSQPAPSAPVPAPTVPTTTPAPKSASRSSNPSAQSSSSPQLSNVSAPLATSAPQAARSTPPPVEHTAAKPVTAPTETSTSEAPSAPKIIKKGDVTIRSFDNSTPAPAEETAAFTVVVRAAENSWISVIADGQLVTQETLIAPAATSFHAKRELTVRVGNAAGVTFLFQGQEFPPQGAEAEAKTLVFDAQGLHTNSTPQP